MAKRIETEQDLAGISGAFAAEMDLKKGKEGKKKIYKAKPAPWSSKTSAKKKEVKKATVKVEPLKKEAPLSEHVISIQKRTAKLKPGHKYNHLWYWTIRDDTVIFYFRHEKLAKKFANPEWDTIGKETDGTGRTWFTVKIPAPKETIDDLIPDHIKWIQNELDNMKNVDKLQTSTKKSPKRKLEAGIIERDGILFAEWDMLDDYAVGRIYEYSAGRDYELVKTRHGFYTDDLNEIKDMINKIHPESYSRNRGLSFEEFKKGFMTKMVTVKKPKKGSAGPVWYANEKNGSYQVTALNKNALEWELRRCFMSRTRRTYAQRRTPAHASEWVVMVMDADFARCEQFFYKMLFGLRPIGDWNAWYGGNSYPDKDNQRMTKFTFTRKKYAEDFCKVLRRWYG